MSIDFTSHIRNGTPVDVHAAEFEADPSVNCYSIDEFSVTWEGTDTLVALTAEEEQRLYEEAWERYADSCVEDGDGL